MLTRGCRSFTVFTARDTMQYFLTQKTLVGRKARWQELISPFAPIMKIHYRPGPQNRADALARLPSHAANHALVVEIGFCPLFM